MLIILGALIVSASVITGYVAHGGNLAVLWQPFEILIIFGAAGGAFISANNMHTIKAVAGAWPRLLSGTPFNRAFYLDLLSLLYDLFDKSRKQGVMAIEADVDDPHESQIFTRYPAIMKNGPLLDFITDYLRIISAGNMAAHELEGLMDQEIEMRLHELEEPSHAVTQVADGLPALGIVAAILGIIITMGHLGGSTEQVGALIAAALAGTLMGIWAAYGYVGPIAISMGRQAKEEIKAYECAKNAILATVSGQAPQMAIEFGRKVLNTDSRPNFQQLDDHVRSK
ncbi:MAG: flagellar motor stator protein MotA [Halomonadaceae bacterium]|nr:MAG: flagellar motor stator protein MotA [Halomonadaceae bacterium]